MNSHAPTRYPVNLSCVFVCQALSTAVQWSTCDQSCLTHPNTRLGESNLKRILYFTGKVFSFYYSAASPRSCVWLWTPHTGSCLALVSYTGDLFPACLLCPLNLSLPASDYVFVKFKLPKERFFWVELAALLLLHRGHKLAGLCEMGHSWAGPLLVRPVGVIPRSVSQRQGIAMAVTQQTIGCSPILINSGNLMLERI